MLTLYYISLFATNHYHQTEIAKLSSINWSKTSLFLSLAAWVSEHMLKAYHAFNVPSCKGPRSRTPYNFEVLPGFLSTVTVEDYCARIHFFL